MPSTSDRLDRLEAENAALKAEVDRLKNKVEPPKPPPPPPIIHNGSIGSLQTPGGIEVRTIPDPPPPEMTWENVRDLRRMVGKAYPRLISLSSAVTEQQALQRFYNALHAVQNFHGTDRLDTEHTLSWWVDKARDVVAHGSDQPGFDGHDFTAAAMALNVPCREWTNGTAMHFAMLSFVSFGSSAYNFPLKDQWRVTLERGAILSPEWIAGPASP